MTLWEMLDKTLYDGNVLIYERNTYDQCMKIFQGKVNDAKQDSDRVWDYLMQPIEQWICGNRWTLIYVKNHYYNDLLETQYSNSDKWTREKHPWKSSYEVENELRELVG